MPGTNRGPSELPDQVREVGVEGRTRMTEGGVIDALPTRCPEPVVDITFTVEVRADIRSIALVGDFNDWSPTATPMHRDDGRFEATVCLAVGRRYRYQFLVDGERWENDWTADDYEETDRGAYVSVIDLSTADWEHPAGWSCSGRRRIDRGCDSA